MSTIQEQLGLIGSTDLTPHDPIQDFNDVSIDSINDDNKAVSMATSIFEKISDTVAEDISFLNDIDSIDPIDPKLLFAPEDPESGFSIADIETGPVSELLGKGVETGISLAGKGISLAGELFKRLNILVTAAPPIQMIIGGGEQTAKKFNENIFRVVQYYGMLNANGKMSRDEITKYVENVVGGDIDDFEVPIKDILLNMQILVSPTEWWKFLKTATRVIIPVKITDATKKAEGVSFETFGEALGEKYYKTLIGKNPSDAWVGLMDFSFETLITAPVAVASVVKKTLQSVKKTGQVTRIIPQTKLSITEIKELKKFYANWGITKLSKNPALARTELKKLSGLSKYSTDAKLEKYLSRTAIDYQKELELLIGRPLRGGVIIGKEKVKAAREILDTMLSDIQPARKAAEAQKALSRSRKFKKAFTARGGATGEKAAKEARWALKGDDFVHDFEVDLDFLTQDMRDELFDIINALPEWDAQHASSGMWKILDKKLPNRSEVAVLEKAFGTGVFDRLETIAGIHLSPGEILTDLANLPRALQTSFDMGAPLRQGNFALKAGYADDWGDAFVKMLKVGRHKEYADTIEDLTRVGVRAGLYREAGLEFTTLSKFAKLTAREEQYLSTFAEKIPIIGRGVKWSERTHGAFLNQLRMNVFDSQVTLWRSEGRVLAGKDLKALGDYVNHMTGRGDLKTANKILRSAFGIFGKEVKPLNMPTTASAVFYSPRFFLSKIQVHTDLFATESNLVRKLIARDLTKYYYTNIQMLRLAKTSEETLGWEVEDNPTSPDFGKIIVGNIRYDVWGPMSPVMRFMARLESGVSKSTVTKEIKEISRKDLSIRFLRSKSSPSLGLIWDLLEGETFIGEDVDVTSPAGIVDIAQQRIVPLVVQDIIDAIRFSDTGFLSVSAAAGSAFFGNGTVTYRPSPFQEAYTKKEILSKELFGKRIDDLDFSERMSLLKMATIDPEIALLEREGLFERGADLGEFIAKENRKSEIQIKNKIPKDVVNIIDGTFTNIRGVSKNIEFNGITLELGQDEFRVYKELIAKNITVNIRIFQIAPSEQADLLYIDAKQVDKAIQLAIKQAQSEIVIKILDR